jgi:hypothetical protein
MNRRRADDTGFLIQATAAYAGPALGGGPASAAAGFSVVGENERTKGRLTAARNIEGQESTRLSF